MHGAGLLCGLRPKAGRGSLLIVPATNGMSVHTCGMKSLPPGTTAHGSKAHLNVGLTTAGSSIDIDHMSRHDTWTTVWVFCVTELESAVS